MYSEKTFKNYIFWVQVKRVVLIILISCIGAALGVLISELYESIAKTNSFNIFIIVITTVIMFLFSLLLTMGTGKEVQDGYWKIAVLRKLTVIQKLIETNNSLLGNNENIESGLLSDDNVSELLDIANDKSKEEILEKVTDVECEEENFEVQEETEKKVSKKKKKETIEKVKETI